MKVITMTCCNGHTYNYSEYCAVETFYAPRVDGTTYEARCPVCDAKVTTMRSGTPIFDMSFNDTLRKYYATQHLRDQIEKSKKRALRV